MARNSSARIQLENAVLNALGLGDRKDVEGLILFMDQTDEPFRAVVTFIPSEERTQTLADQFATYRFTSVEEAD